MTGKTHQALGVTTGIGYFLLSCPPQYSPATLGAIAVSSHLSALLPDIDQPAAEIWHKLPFGHTLGKISDPVLKHRNITHSILGFALIGTGMFFLFKIFPDYWGINKNVLIISSLISYASHILADMFTVEGVPLLFPYTKMIGIPPRPFEGIRMMTGKWFENLVIFPAINLVLIILIIAKWQEIKQILLK